MNAQASKLDQAFAKHQAGDIDGATQLYREVLVEDAQQPDALHMLGAIAQQKGNPELALKLIEAALATRPDMAWAWHNRSLVLRVLGRKTEALQSSERAIELDPNFPEAWDMAGMMLRELKQPERAREAHARAVALRPNDLKFQSDYALVLYATNDLCGAYKLMRDILKRDPAIVALTLGNVLKSAGYPERALAYISATRERLTDNFDVRLNEAITLLQMGDFERGWAVWETRRDLNPRFQHLPFWQGEPVDHLLLYEDQGMGDTLQCMRYIPMLAKRVRRMTLQITRDLQPLLKENFPDLDIITLDEPTPEADARLRLLSLPAIFKTRLDNIPSRIPYIHARTEWREPWRTRLAHLPSPRVGIVWGGNPDNLNDYKRSIIFAELAPLVQAGGAQLVSLQKGRQKTGADLAVGNIYDADLFLNDFTDTAGLIAELDLLITVDTAVAHLAGAMGKPVWLLLPFDPDWRWLLGREDSPWYPTLRLFRQTEPRHWPPVIRRVAEALQKFLGGDKNVLSPTRWTGPALRQDPHAVILPED